jgi:S1-C subfamily serine protease
MARFLVFIGILLSFHGFPCSVSNPAHAERQPFFLISNTTGLTPGEQATISVFKKATRSVVYITNKAIRRDVWSLNTFEVPQGSGSGFIWDTQGHIVTNFHVVYGADAIQIVLDDQSSHDAKIVGVDPDHDLAMLKVQAPKHKLVPLALGNSQNLQVGQQVLAIGNPFGLDHTLTTGVVSALGRSIKSVTDRTIEGVIQTDAAINPGNSGGPLLDSAGRLIGVNTQIISPSGAFAGIGFAVPVQMVNRIVPQIVKYGKVIRPGFGIGLIPERISARWGIKGLAIAKVQQGSSADRAGLKPARQTSRGRILLGDIIQTVDGEPVRSFDDLARILDRHQVGDTVSIKIRRNKRTHSLSIKLQAIN